MASPIPIKIMTLLSQYSFEVDPDSTKECLKCTICSRLMIDAHQAYCGCVYCHQCIVNYLEAENKFCYGDKNVCHDKTLELEKNVNRNPFLNWEILRVKVFCPNKPCSFKSDLDQMDEHIRNCIRQTLQCPYAIMGCHNLVTSKDSILGHINNDALAHAQLLIQWINDLKSNCQISKQEISTLRNDFKIKDEQDAEQKREIEKDSNNKEREMYQFKQDIASLQREDESFRTRFGTIQESVEILKRRPTDYLDAMESKLLKVEERNNNEMGDFRKLTESMQEEISGLTNQMKDLKTQFGKITSELESAKQHIELTNKKNEIEKEFKSLKLESQSNDRNMKE